MSLPRRSFNRIALHHPQLPSALYVVCRFICLYLSIPLLIPGFYILSKLLWSVFACVGVFADSCLPFICSWVSWELWPSSLSPIFLSTPLLIAFFRFSFFWIFLHSPLPLSASYSSILFCVYLVLPLSLPYHAPILLSPTPPFCLSFFTFLFDLLLLRLWPHVFFLFVNFLHFLVHACFFSFPFPLFSCPALSHSFLPFILWQGAAWDSVKPMRLFNAYSIRRRG